MQSLKLKKILKTSIDKKDYTLDYTESLLKDISSGKIDRIEF